MNITKLKELEKIQNDGRGVSCVRTIIFYIEKNDMQAALNCCINENDKIRSYPEIQQELKILFPKYKKFF